jgi:4-amino-4-deoxy-L-arabinose transferase-like glycosyltransferase
MLLPLPLWIAAAEADLPGAAWQVVVNEHILRFLGKREPHDYYGGPVWYYVPRLFLFFFPWAGALLFGWIGRARNVPAERAEVRRFLWLCVWIPFIFFSLSNAKANYYVLVCLPPMALLTADYLPCLVRERRGFHLSMAVALPILLFVAIWAYRVWLIRTGATNPLLPTHDGSGPRTIAALVALSILVLVVVRTGRRRLAVLCLGFLLVPVSMQFDHLVIRAEPYISAKPLAALIQDRFPQAHVYLYQDFEAAGALPIYLNRTIPVIDSRSNDLYFGHSILPHHPSFVTADQVMQERGERLIVVLNDRLKAFAGTELAGRVEDVAVIGRARLFRLVR